MRVALWLLISADAMRDSSRGDGRRIATERIGRVRVVGIVGPYGFLDQQGIAGECCERDVGSISPDPDSHQPAHGHQSRGVEKIPLTVQEGFHETVEVRRLQTDRVTRHVTRRDAHAATQRDRQMRVVTTDTCPLQQDVCSGRRRIRAAGGVVEMLRDPIANRLHTAETARHLTKFFKREPRQQIALAVSARVQIGENLGGHFGRVGFAHEVGRLISGANSTLP